MTSILTLDGSNRITATEFIKLEATGSSNLATEQFALDNGGGGGGGGGSVDAYTKTETDSLLNNKVDLTGETLQTISGSVDITAGLGITGNISCNNANCGNVYLTPITTKTVI